MHLRKRGGVPMMAAELQNNKWKHVQMVFKKEKWLRATIERGSNKGQKVIFIFPPSIPTSVISQ